MPATSKKLRSDKTTAMTEPLQIKSLAFSEARQWLEEHLPTADTPVASPIPPSTYGLDGFLFAISQAPVPVSASQWLGDVLALFTESERGSDALNAILSYQRHLESRCGRRDYPIPDTEGFDAVSQIQPGATLNDWSLGFEAGFAHVEDIWQRLIPAELTSELQSQRFALTFFGSPDNARRFLAQRESALRPEQLADQVLAQFPRAVDLHARLSISVGQIAVAKMDTKVGRNDPCPCGSGRKYKNCCLQ